MATTTKPTVKVMVLDDIRPYWRNPREIPEEAVRAVADSIERYGYRQMITVDREGVIITGHTRYAALRRLDFGKVPVVVADDLTEEQVREYRVMDNKVQEFSSWDDDALMLELREFDASLAEVYFPDVDLQLGDLDADDFAVDGEQMDKATAKVESTGKAAEHPVVTITCPSCYHLFEVKADTL